MTGADALRYATLAITLFALGMVPVVFLVKTKVSYWHVVPVAVAQIGYMLYVFADVAGRLGDPLTWRAPCGLILATLVAFALTFLARWQYKAQLVRVVEDTVAAIPNRQPDPDTPI